MLWASIALAEQACRRESLDYVIVGAGPGGLQLAVFLQSRGRNYAVLERAASAGSFFQVHPRHRKLESINKVHTGSSTSDLEVGMQSDAHGRL